MWLLKHICTSLNTEGQFLKLCFFLFLFFTEIRYRKVIPIVFTKMDYKNKTRDREIISKWKKEWRSTDRWKRIALIESLEYTVVSYNT